MSSAPTLNHRFPVVPAVSADNEISENLVRFTEVQLLMPGRFGDARGFFSETFNRSQLEQRGIRHDWVQDNHSLSEPRGVVRGLHFQVPPQAQAKLIRVVRGAIFDVVVDLRPDSPTRHQHAWAVLSAENWRQLYVPIGFAHGFCTLQQNTEVIYKVSAYYSRADERAVLWNDPALGIPWPLEPEEAVLSAKDGAAPLLAELPVIDWA